MKELISIIVAVYNGENYLNQCIESIVNQTYKELEIIIVDDGSNDSSYNIIKKYGERDDRIKIIHQLNGGVSMARNAALDVAKGEYIAFIDQDDYISKEYIEYLHKLIIQNNADISLTPQVDKFTEKSGHSKTILNDDIELWSGNEAIIQMLNYKIIIAPWNKLIRKSVIDNNNLRFIPGLFAGEGFLYSICCFKFSKRVVVGKKKIYHYRLDNPQSGMTKFNKSIVINSLKAQQLIRENLMIEDRNLFISCKYAEWHTCVDCYNFMVGCHVEREYSDLFNKVKRIMKEDTKYAFRANVGKKDKIKIVGYYIIPNITAKIINRFRIRKFTRDI